MIISIHQPNFMPWLPYFNKIKMCDVFVVLVHCQFEKNGYQNRFNVGDEWYTMSVNKGLTPIVEKRYVNYNCDWGNIKKRIGKSILNEFDGMICETLWKTNYDIICKICKTLGIKTKIELDYPTDLKSTDRLVDICKKYNAKKYIAGQSGANYMDVSKFIDNNIEIEYQKIEDSDKVAIVEVL